MEEKESAPEAKKIVEDSQRLVTDAQHLYQTIREENPITFYYQKSPYAVLAAAAGMGYILGGGLLTPFTRRIVRVGLKAMALPIAASQIKELTGNATGDDISIGNH